jgi:hypothetical protein
MNAPQAIAAIPAVTAPLASIYTDARVDPAFFAEHGYKIVRYDPQTGAFINLDPPVELFLSANMQAYWRTRYAGKPAGRVSTDGYLHITFRRRKIYAHRYAWFLETGDWPVLVDHLNGNPLDNRICNLREADESLNRMNMRMRSDNTSGFYGVFFRKDEQRWRAEICIRGQRIRLGSFKTKEEAVAARLAEQVKHPFGPNHGSKRR